MSFFNANQLYRSDIVLSSPFPLGPLVVLRQIEAL
jgi:hypothetical protein